MPKQNYLCIQRSQPGKGEKPSPAQMEEMYAKFNAWKEKFHENIVDMGGKLKGGGKVGVRAPMREDEQPVVRPYVLTKDIEAAVKAAQAAGAEIAIPPMEIPGHGRFAIYIHGGIEHGLWQL